MAGGRFRSVITMPTDRTHRQMEPAPKRGEPKRGGNIAEAQKGTIGRIPTLSWYRRGIDYPVGFQNRFIGGIQPGWPASISRFHHRVCRQSPLTPVRRPGVVPAIGYWVPDGVSATGHPGSRAVPGWFRA